jgi:hypothetical protein
VQLAPQHEQCRREQRQADAGREASVSGGPASRHFCACCFTQSSRLEEARVELVAIVAETVVRGLDDSTAASARCVRDECAGYRAGRRTRTVVEWMAASGSGVTLAAMVAVLNVGSFGTRCVR